jgi:hypothetical protein
MQKLLIAVLCVFLLATAARVCLAAQAGPVVLYTDLLSGPNTGGENNHGTYLSVFGQNFGTSAGMGANTRVFIGGVEVAEYRYLGPSMGRPDIQQLTVQVGALGNPTPGIPLPVEVQVGKASSSSFTSQTFTVNPGRILFVSLTGDDATAIAADINHPWRHMQTPVSTVTKSTGAWGVARPGDVIVMRGGHWTDLGFGGPRRPYFVKFIGNGGTRPTGTRGTGPISITGYPGERVVVEPPVKIAYGVFDGANAPRLGDGPDNPKYSHWITISNLVIPTGGINDGPVNLETGSDHWRVVNNDLAAPDAVTNRAAGVTGNGKHEEVLGNHIHDIAGVGSRGETLLDHGIYIDSGSDWELAYNLIENITGGSGIQLYNSGHATPTIDRVNIHHNWIRDIAKHGLNLGDTSGTGILIWSNVVLRTVGGCWRNNSVNLQGAKIWNNTFYDCNTSGSFGAIWNDVKNVENPITADFRNNIVCAANASKEYASGETGFHAGGVQIGGNKNLWCKGKSPASAGFDTEAMFADPKFVKANGKRPDFHLQAASPARNSGDTSVIPMVISNYDFAPNAARATAINRGAF